MSWHQDNQAKLQALSNQLDAVTTDLYDPIQEAALTKNLTRLESLQEQCPGPIRLYVQPLIDNLKQLPEKLYQAYCPGVPTSTLSAVSRSDAHEIVYGYVQAFYPRRKWRPEYVTIVEVGK